MARMAPFVQFEALFFGSSPKSGERRADFEEEIAIVSEAVSDSFDDFDLVVDAFDEVGPEWPAAMGNDSLDIGLEVSCEPFERFQATSQGAVAPGFPGFACPGLASVSPQLLELVLEHVHREQSAVGSEQFLEAHAIVRRERVAIAQ